MSEKVWHGAIRDVVPDGARWFVDSQDLGNIMDRLRSELGITTFWTTQYAGFFIIESENDGYVFVAGTFVSVPWVHSAVEILYQDGQISPYADVVTWPE